MCKKDRQKAIEAIAAEAVLLDDWLVNPIVFDKPPNFVYEVWEQRPNVVVRLRGFHQTNRHMALGFAKVNWPDKWDPVFGRELALRKAAADLLRGGFPMEELL